MFKMFFVRYEAKRNGSYQIGLSLREKSDIMFKNRVNYKKLQCQTETRELNGN